MENCFVIQPFDNDKYDRRYTDVFSPAILKAGLTPYRVDRDPSVRVPIDDIEREIRGSSICFAEITTNNPNVWYELGFAFASGKDVVMVCVNEERPGKFPFDIQHRHIVTYRTGSKSDFEILEEQITKKIRAFLQKKRTVETLVETPVIDNEGLKSHEIAILILLVENQLTSEEFMATHYLKSEMNKAGYTDVATSVGIKTLAKGLFIKTFMADDNWNNNQYSAVQLADKGEDWILNNQDKLVFRKEYVLPITIQDNQSEELPF